MEYHFDINVDLPAVLHRRVAREIGVIGLGVSRVTDAMDMAVQYNVPSDGSVWKISLDVKLMEHLGVLEPTIAAAGGYFQMYAFSLDPYDVTFVCQIGEDDPSYGYDVREYRGSHKPFPQDALDLPPYLKRWYNNSPADDDSLMDYIDAWVNQQCKKLWPAHMERVADGFWSFLMRLASGEAFPGIMPKMPAADAETEEEMWARVRREEANALAFYQKAERRRQNLVNISMSYR